MPVRLKKPIMGKSIVEFTPHSLARMITRGVTQDQVIAVIESPTVKGLKTAPNRYRVRRQLNKGQELDVVYAIQPDRLIVITTFFKS